MGVHLVAGVGARRIGLVEEGQGTAGMGLAHQLHGDGAAADIGKFGGPVDHLGLVFLFQVERKEFHQRHGNAPQHLLQGADGRADAVFLDHGNRAVGDTRALGELTLGKAFQLADGLQSNTDVQWRDPPWGSGVLTVAVSWQQRSVFTTLRLPILRELSPSQGKTSVKQ
ncbi:hypothetical protein D3C85_1136050 [compost metagenome]